MAQVPTVTGPSVRLDAAPNAYQNLIGPQDDGNARLLGKAAQVATAYSAYAKRQQDEADQVRVDDAVNRIKEKQLDLTFGKEKGFTHLTGLNALERQGGRPLSDEYGDELQKAISDATNGLGNDRQKRALQMKANDILTGFKGQIMQHEGQQFQTYQTSVREGTIANRQREVGLYYNDPAKIDEAVLSINGAVAAQGRTLGKSAEWIEAQQREQTSKAHTIALSAALERNDVAYADGYLKKYTGQMNADDILRVRGVIDKQMDAGAAVATATRVMSVVQTKTQPTDFDRVMNITMQTESGGKRYGKDGQLLRSPAGAKGEMQVMDGTNLAPGFGVKPAADNSPDERARVGRDYLVAMVKRYDGDMGKAWAAYNAGPGRLDEALKKDSVNWLAKMPEETRNYVAKNMAALQQDGGRPERPTLQDVHNQVRAEIGTGRPMRLKLAIEESTRQYDDMTKAIKQREDSAVADAQRELMSNGGRVSALSASTKAALPPGQMDNLLNFGERIAKGEDRTNPAVYQQLSNPEYLRSLSEDQFYILSTRELSQADRKHFADRRGQELKGAASDKPSDLNNSGIKNILDARLRELNFDPTPKDGSDDAGRVGAMRLFVDRSILREQASRGKKLNDAELTKHIDGLFAQTDVVRGLFSDTSKPLLTMKAGDIPRDVRDKLRTDFKGVGIDDPTDAQLLGAYWSARTAQNKKRKIAPLATLPDTQQRQSGTVQ